MVARAMPREELEATGSPPVQMHDLYDLLTLELRAEARNGLRPVSRWSATWAERFMFRWFESRIDPFARTGIVMPPSALLSFYWHFVRPIWPVFALILFFDLLALLVFQVQLPGQLPAFLPVLAEEEADALAGIVDPASGIEPGTEDEADGA